MGMPLDIEARRFYRVAFQRLEEGAEVMNMATIVRGTTDKAVADLRAALDKYESLHPGSEASLYRQNPGSIRVRVIDDRFAGMSRSQRHDELWDFLSHEVGDDVMGEVSVLLEFPRSELARSLANLDYEDPLPSDS
jgi:stress-induced morphogen